MPHARNGEVRLHWRRDGSGPPLLLLNSIGFDLSLWDGVASHLGDFSVVRMDTRGHGQSDAPAGDYTLDQLADDALCVLDAADVPQAAVCGLSLGGMVAMTLALRAKARVSALIPACTSAQMDPTIWDNRITLVRTGGMAAVADVALPRFFSENFRQLHPRTVGAVRGDLLAVDPQGYAGCCAAIRDMNLLADLPAIAAPTLVIAGDKDVATPFQGHGDEICSRIQSARSVLVPAGHIAPLEIPESFAATVKDFIAGPSHAR